MTVYRRTQIGWATLVAFAVAEAIVVAATRRLPGALAGATVLLAGCAVVFSTLTVEVDGDGIGWWFTGGVARRRVRFDEVRAIRARRIIPFGLGLHTNLAGTWLYNVSGTRLVEIETERGLRYQVGCDDPEAIIAAVRKHVIVA